MGYWSGLFWQGAGRSLLKYVPVIEPNLLSALGVVFSVFTYAVMPNIQAAAAMLTVAILMDGLDGAVARRIGRNNTIIDFACDRISELIICFAIPFAFPVAVANIFLASLNLQGWEKLPSISIKFFVLVYLVAQLL